MTNAIEEKEEFKSYAKYPHVIFRKVKNFATKENQNGTEEPTYWILRVDSTHNQESALSNFIKDGNRIIGHKNLSPKKHGAIMAFIDSITGVGVDPRLFDNKPDSVMDAKVKNEKARRES